MKTALLVFLVLLQLPLFAQDNEPVNLKEYFLDAEYFFAQEEYLDALYDYLELYNNGYKENANINYRIGICYLNIPGQKEKSIDYLLEALKGVSPKYRESSLKQQNAPLDAYLYLGNAYRVNNMLGKAIESYNNYKELAGSVEETKYADQQIVACNTAIQFMDNPALIRLTNLGDSVNGPASNYKAVISGDGKTMVYMNELPFYDAIYVSKYNGTGWSAPVNITPLIQSDGDQFVSSISYDGNELFLTREDAFNSDIYVSRFQNGKWSRSEPIPGQLINTKYWESHASISRDGKTLYFTSNRKDGFGEMDIYKSQIQGNGQWGQPVNLGNVINTGLNEDTPFVTENDSVLYFSSQGHENMGGYDIFRSVRIAGGQWSKPENIRYPMNTTDDDLFYYPWHNARIGYASLIRSGGYGKEDIYAVQPADDKPLNDLLAELMVEEAPEVPVVAEIPPVAPAPAAAEQALPAAPDEAPSPAPGAVSEVSVTPDVKPEIGEKPQSLPPASIELKPVYFAFDNFQLNGEGKEQLGKVYQLLKDYPDLRVRLLGHADAKGTAEYNLTLSEKRAASALKYLVELGVESGRLSSKGLGERNYAAINTNPDGTDNPEGRRLNRRVEYEITGDANKMIIITLPPVPEELRFRE